MDADNLLRISKGQIYGMRTRSLVLAIRYDLADWENSVNVQKMLAVIESGDVWGMRGVGEKTVREWCIFLSQRINSAAQHPLEAGGGDSGDLDDLSTPASGSDSGPAAASLSGAIGMRPEHSTVATK